MIRKETDKQFTQLSVANGGHANFFQESSKFFLIFVQLPKPANLTIKSICFC